MTQTNRSDIYKQREREKRLSHIKDVKKNISTNFTNGLLNNQKWSKIFEWLDDYSFDFQIKTLLSDDYKTCTFIRELEQTALLINDNGVFIEFLEIEHLKVKKTNELLILLNNLNIEYDDQQEFIEIDGYRK